MKADKENKFSKSLEKIIKVSAPIIVAGAVVVGLEYSGLPKYVQEYELAKASVTTEFFGDFLGAIRTGGAYISRGAIDMLGAIISSYSAYALLDKKFPKI